MFGSLNRSGIRIFFYALLSVLAVNAWALEDEVLAPTKTAKNYVSAYASYSDFERDQIIRATGEKGGESKAEGWQAGVSGFYVGSDNFDVRATLYRWNTHYTRDWLGSRVEDDKSSDPLNMDASLRYKLLSSEKGGLVGQFHAWYGSSENHGYEVDIKPYINLSPTMAATLRLGVGGYKTDDGRQQKEYARAGLVWKPYSNLVLNPGVGITHYESLDAWSSFDVYRFGLSARYDINPKWSVAPSLTYYRYGDRHNNQYTNELGNGDEVVMSIELRHHFN